MSLISTQVRELRKKLQPEEAEEIAKLLYDAADTIDELSAKLHALQMERSTQYYNGGLIPVSERLPEPDIGTMNEVSKSVLVCLKDKEDGTIFFCTGYYGYFPDRAPEKRGWWCYYDSDKGKKIESEVLYWMPLPEIYKESEVE